MMGKLFPHLVVVFCPIPNHPKCHIMLKIEVFGGIGHIYQYIYIYIYIYMVTSRCDCSGHGEGYVILSFLQLKQKQTYNVWWGRELWALRFPTVVPNGIKWAPIALKFKISGPSWSLQSWTSPAVHKCSQPG
jgi:hypothetical protein